MWDKVRFKSTDFATLLSGDFVAPLTQRVHVDQHVDGPARPRPDSFSGNAISSAVQCRRCVRRWSGTVVRSLLATFSSRGDIGRARGTATKMQGDVDAMGRPLDAIKRLTPAIPSVSTTCVLSASPSPQSASPSSADDDDEPLAHGWTVL